jgi:hypothetical protein
MSAYGRLPYLSYSMLETESVVSAAAMVEHLLEFKTLFSNALEGC